MSCHLNPNKSKPLIEYEGKPLIRYLLEWAKEGGLEEFFISVNNHNRSKIEEIADSLDISYETSITGETFRHIPELFREKLDERFIVVCGHHAVPPEHFRKMIKAAEGYTTVFTAYLNTENSFPFPKQIIAKNFKENFPLDLELIDLNHDDVSKEYILVTHPYVMTLAMLDETKQDSFQHSFGYFIYKHSKNGEKSTAIRAIMPVEFDYDGGFYITRKFLNVYINKINKSKT